MELMQAHWFTVIVIGFSVLMTPAYWFLVLPQKKAFVMAGITIVMASLMLTLCLFNVTERLGPLGGMVIGISWVLPPLLVWVYRSWFFPLQRRPLVALQVFRLIGALFLLEMARGFIPGSFAYPAGIGDILVGLFAVWLLWRYSALPRQGMVILIVIGVLDFLSAFFFGFTSFPGPFQLFSFGFDNQTNLFPTGMIPIFLVPYAITYHVLSWIDLRRQG